MFKNISRVKHRFSIMVLLLGFFVFCQQFIPIQVYSKTSKETTITNTSSTTSVNSFRSISKYKLNYTKYKLIKGKTFSLRVTKLPANYKVTYKSKNTRIATVTNKGIITGIKNGTASVVATVKYRNQILRRLTCKVTVGPAAISVVIPESKISLNLGETEDLNTIVKPKCSVESPRYKSSNPNIVTVTSSGIIRGIKKGSAVITVSIGNKKFDTCRVTVTGKKKK